MNKKTFLLAVAGLSAVLLFSVSSAYAAVPVFSQGSVSINVNQTLSISSTGSSTAVYLSFADSSVANILTSGTQITVTGVGAGTTSANICYAGTATDCSNLNISVLNGGAPVISFGQSNVSLTLGQTASTTITGGSGTYVVNSNSNPAAVQPTISGANVSFYGNSSGAANIAICSADLSACGTITVNINSAGSSGSLIFDPLNPSLAVGQSANVTVSGGTGFYLSGNTNSNVASYNLSGNSVNIAGLSVGTTALTVCSSINGCGAFNVTVSAASATPPPATPPPAPAPAPSPTPPPPTSVAAALAEIQAMQSQLAALVAQIQTMQTKLAQLLAQIVPALPSTGATAASGGYKFVNPLAAGSVGADVTALQNFLKAQGLYSGPVNGSYGLLTKAAVMKFQTAHGLEPLGNVGPSTRAALNAGQ